MVRLAALGGTLNLHSGHAFGHTMGKVWQGPSRLVRPAAQRLAHDQSNRRRPGPPVQVQPGTDRRHRTRKNRGVKEEPGVAGCFARPERWRPGDVLHSAKCEALDAPGGRKVQLWDFTGKTRKYFDHVSLTDRMVYFWSTIAEQVTGLPGEVVRHRCLSVYAAPPVQRKLHPNFVVRFAAARGYGDEADRQQSLQDWDGWAKAAKRIFFRSNLMLAGRRTGMPLLYTHRFAEDFRHLANHGMIGTDFDACCHNWATQGLNYYVVAKLHWDPSQNVDAIIDDYCQSGFGPAAKSMRLYYEKLEGNFTASAAAHQSEFSMLHRRCLERPAQDDRSSQGRSGQRLSRIASPRGICGAGPAAPDRCGSAGSSVSC